MRRISHPFLMVVLLVASIATIAKADAPARTVTTSGEAIVFVVPDEVVVNIGIETFNEDLDKARAGNDEMSAKLLKAIKAMGVEERNIQIDRLQLTVEYKDNRVWEGSRGYVAHRGYCVTLKDPKLFEKLIDTALKNGANQINSFEFRTTEIRKYRDQARSMAIKAAKEKAVALAKDLECGVGKPWQISEGSIGYWGGNTYANGNAFAQNQVQAAPAGAGENDSTLPLGQIAVQATVSVVFDLTDK